MNNLATANKTNTSPLERKNIPAPVLDNPENIEGIDRKGFFDEISEGFDATQGSINFSLDTLVPISAVSEIFNKSGEWFSIGKDAGLDLVNQVFGTNQTPESQTPVDPKKQEKLKEQAEYIEKRQQVDNTNNEITIVRNEIRAERNLDEERQRLNELAGFHANFKNVISEKTGEVDIYLKDPIERALVLRNKQAMALHNPIQSASRKGGQGVEGANKANETSGGNTNAQNAVG